MLRKLPLATAIALAMMPFQSQALGLGSISTKSMLNEAFDAEIQLLSVPVGELDGVKVELADPDTYDRAGVDFSYSLSKLRFKTERKNNGDAIIKVFSRELIQEPFLNFLIEVNWPKGRMIREYTVLLDPPLTTRKKKSPVKTAVSSSPAADYTPQSSYNTTPTVSRSSSNTLVSGPSEYGPVQRNETLWTIAERYSGEDVSVYQMMQGILQANPQAFSANNINTLKAGSVLRIPSLEDVTAMSRQEARRLSDAHYDAWKSGLSSTRVTKPAPVETAPVEEKTEPMVAEQAEAAQSEDPVVKLSGSDVATGEGRGAETDSEAIKDELISAQEKVVSSQGEVQDMMARLSLMEQQMADMQRLLELKDEQLAKLQSSNESLEQEAEQSRVALEEAQQVVAEPPPPVQMPEPAPVVESKPAKPQTEMDKVNSVVDLIMSSATLMGIVIGVLIVLLALIWAALSRRKPADDTLSEPVADAPKSDNKAAVAATAAAGATAVAASSAAADDKPAEPEEELSFLKEFTAGGMDSFTDLETGESDPLAEADVYIAYGRYDQAETMVAQALEAEPDNRALQSKLLEIFYANKEQDKFNNLAQSMHDAGAEAEDPDAWNRIKLMGTDIDAENALYADAMDAPSMDMSGDSLDLAEDLDQALTELESQMSEEPEVSSPLPDADSSEPDGDAFDELVAELEADHTDEDSADEVIDLPEMDLPEVDEIAELKAEDNPELDDLAAELENFDLDDISVAEDQAENPVESGFDEDLLLDESLDELSSSLDDVDDVSTKLDLAKAYIEMGDNEGAKGILEEVVEEGSDSQKDEARGLIDSMG